MDRKFHFNAQPHQPRALVGLTNLGNTCFMNSVLQCLNATAPAVAFFLNGHHLQELNKNNSLRGQLAVVFAELLKKLWTGREGSSVSPTEVRGLFVRSAPMFANFGQHDAQECLRFLLDGLHEDLNRIRHKVPYEELKDIKGETDIEKSDRWWSHYRARNDSAVSDIFSGQLRSAVVCAACGHVSTAFDPFYDLSIPIPSSRGRDVTIEACLQVAAPHVTYTIYMYIYICPCLHVTAPHVTYMTYMTYI